MPSLRKLPNSYVAMDLETTGLNPEKDGIVEIAGVKVVDGDVADTFQTYVDTDARMTSAASKVNGITRNMLKGAPKTDEAIASFLAFSDGFTLLGHNAVSFDRRFVERACAFSQGAVAPTEWLDTMDVANKCLGQRPSLAKLCEITGVTNEKAHSALSDALATHECYQWLRGEAAKTTTDARDFPDPAPNGPLVGEVVCFTGECEAMQRHDLMSLVVENGGSLSNNVTLKTTMLVSFADRETGKMRKAAEYSDRTGIRVVSGSDFCELVGISMPEPTAPASPVLKSIGTENGTGTPKKQGGGMGCVVAVIIVLVLLLVVLPIACTTVFR